MHITFSPRRDDRRPAITWQGDVLTVDGEDFDFGALPEGAHLPGKAIASEWIGPVRRAGGQLYVTLVLPHGADAPPEARFPGPLQLNTPGPVPMPLQESRT